jgi:hypothetical protein
MVVAAAAPMSGPAVLRAQWSFVEEFSGAYSNSWQSAAGILPTESLEPLFPRTLPHVGPPASTFVTIDGEMALRLNTASASMWSRYGMLAGANLPSTGGVLEARINTLGQGGSNIDGLFDLWLVNRSDRAKFVRVGLFGDQFDAQRSWTFSTSAETFRLQPLNYAANTWYRVRIEQPPVPGENLRVSIWNDAADRELAAYSFPFTLGSLGAAFDVAVSQWMGGPPGYSLLSAVDYVRAGASVTRTEELVSAGSVWRYRDDGSNQGTTWRDPGFDDSSWQTGPAQLGYGDGDEATVVDCRPEPGLNCGVGTPNDPKFITTYFRNTFDVENPEFFQSVTLYLLRDDGAAVYLNGIEVARDKLTSDAGSNTSAVGAAVSDLAESWFYSFSIDPGLLEIGRNTLAVEIHQQSPLSTDLSFDLRLEATTVIPEPSTAALGLLALLAWLAQARNRR